MRRILVTGAAGFVGRHAVAALAERFAGTATVVGIGRGSFGSLPEGADYRQLDLLDQASLATFVAAFRPTDILHLAALSSVQQAGDLPTETWRANLVGLLNLAEAAMEIASPPNLFFVSSGEVYGRAFLSGAPLSEETEPQPVGSYPLSKRLGEQMLRDVLAKSDAKLIVLRPFNHIGPGQDERFVVASFAGQIARIEAGSRPPWIEVGNLSASRDFLDIDDVVGAYLGLIAQVDALESGAVFNICSGLPRTIESVLADLRAMARVPFEVRIAPDRMRPSEIAVAAGDAGRLTAATGWR
ncbi:NAD-dependent epimerase/dehydratase family protein, partial [Methylobacterium trifolii]